ncbi:MAG: Gfo/Idh/MocA family protein, partial [Spirochaetaceae bacterium]
TNQTKGKVRCAIVGLGRIGSTLESDSLREKPCTHAGAVVADPYCALVGGCDTDSKARERFLADWGSSGKEAGPDQTFEAVEVFEDFDKMLEAAQPDILIVATYPESHRRLTEKAVRAGTPVIICEKPLARSLGDAKAIARIHRSGRAKILVNHERRYSLDYMEARRAVQEGRYGELLSVKGTLCFGSTLPRREVLLHDGTHMLDAVNFLVCGNTPDSGKEQEAGRTAGVKLHRRFGSMKSAEKSAFLFGRAGRIPVCIEAGSQRDHLVFELELGFEEGRIRVGNGTYSFERSAESPYYEGYRSLIPDPDAPARPEKTGYFSEMVADAVRCVREPEHQPLSSAIDALEVMKFIRSVKIWY